jgi:hypothetical protein
MQIQLKQSEIIAAVKQYIVAQGININGKSIDIAFSATRGDAGIVANVNIEEANIPGFTDSNIVDEDAKPALSVVNKPSVAEPAPAVKADAEKPAEGDAPTAKPSSLFNN